MWGLECAVQEVTWLGESDKDVTRQRTQVDLGVGGREEDRLSARALFARPNTTAAPQTGFCAVGWGLGPTPRRPSPTQGMTGWLSPGISSDGTGLQCNCYC